MINCTQCGRTILIDTKAPGHATILNPDKNPNTIQCQCGKYI